MKILKILAFVAIFGIVGVAVWYFTRKKAASVPASTLPPLGTATPPINGAGLNSGPTSTSTGTGLAAINRRISEILASSAWELIQSQVRANLDILTGVSSVKKSYYNQNISRDPITSAKNVPLNLSPAQKQALESFKTIDPISGGGVSGGRVVTENLRAANQILFNALNTCYVGGPELEGQFVFDTEVICQGYQNCGKDYKSVYTTEIGNGAKKAADDMRKMSTNWLNGVSTFENNVKSKAIEDLRAAGWRFIGYDQ